MNVRLMLIAVLFLPSCYSDHGIQRNIDSLFSMEEQLQSLRSKNGESAPPIGDQLLDEYRRHLGTRLHAVLPNEHSTDVLSELFRAAETVAFYTADERVIDDMVAIYDALLEKNAATGQQAASLFGSFVQLRRFDLATRLAEVGAITNPELLPTLVGTPTTASSLPGILVPSADNLTVAFQTRELRAVRLVVVGHPRCHFTAWAGEALHQDAELRKWFGEHSLWLKPADQSLVLPALADWNARFPELTMANVYRERDWPGIDFDSTPVFFFLRDGIVIEKVTGWPKEGRIAEIKAAVATVDTAWSNSTQH